MNMTRDRVQSIVWAVVIALSLALLAALTFRVNAVKSQVRLTERKIIAIKQEQLSLETEFQTRANQQQLAAINQVEFGFKAPDELQYVAGERQLAALSRPVPPAFAPTAPASASVRLASADDVGRPARGPTQAGATGSLPTALAQLAGQRLPVGSGTRYLADRHETKAKPEPDRHPDRGARIALSDDLTRKPRASNGGRQ